MLCLAQPAWERPPAGLALLAGEVHLWRAALDLPTPTIQGLHQRLSADEQARAACMRSPASRSRFIAGRGMLRVLLGRYLGAAPDRVELAQGGWGKPELAEQPAAGRLEFSLSHSRGLALYAFARGRAIGVDLEHVRAGDAWERIAQRHLAAGERAALAGLAKPERSAAFFACWVCKEAYLKAIGVGLAHALRQAEIRLRPDGAPELAAHQGWWLHLFTPRPGFVAALAAPKPAGRLQCCFIE